MLHADVTKQIISAFYQVYNTMGYGFLERVYENALVHEISKKGLSVAQQKPIAVHYDGKIVGEYFADLIVADKVLVELKSAEKIHRSHVSQLMNYLRATEMEVGLLLNFGPQAAFKRKILTNDRKLYLKKSV